jgi:hypothetical protein
MHLHLSFKCISSIILFACVRVSLVPEELLTKQEMRKISQKNVVSVYFIFHSMRLRWVLPDILTGDPLNHGVNISKQGIIQRDRIVFSLALKYKVSTQ